MCHQDPFNKYTFETIMGKIKPFVGLLPEITIVKLSSNGIIVKNIIPSIDFFK